MGGRVNPTVAELVTRAFPHAVQVERCDVGHQIGALADLVLGGRVLGRLHGIHATAPGCPREVRIQGRMSHSTPGSGKVRVS